jgi:hypothetical protein
MARICSVWPSDRAKGRSSCASTMSRAPTAWLRYSQHHRVDEPRGEPLLVTDLQPHGMAPLCPTMAPRAGGARPVGPRPAGGVHEHPSPARRYPVRTALRPRRSGTRRPPARPRAIPFGAAEVPRRGAADEGADAEVKYAASAVRLVPEPARRRHHRRPGGRADGHACQRGPQVPAPAGRAFPRRCGASWATVGELEDERRARTPARFWRRCAKSADISESMPMSRKGLIRPRRSRRRSPASARSRRAAGRQLLEPGSAGSPTAAPSTAPVRSRSVAAVMAADARELGDQRPRAARLVSRSERLPVDVGDRTPARCRRSISASIIQRDRIGRIEPAVAHAAILVERRARSPCRRRPTAPS